MITLYNIIYHSLVFPHDNMRHSHLLPCEQTLHSSFSPYGQTTSMYFFHPFHSICTNSQSKPFIHAFIALILHSSHVACHLQNSFPQQRMPKRNSIIITYLYTWLISHLQGHLGFWETLLSHPLLHLVFS